MVVIGVADGKVATVKVYLPRHLFWTILLNLQRVTKPKLIVVIITKPRITVTVGHLTKTTETARHATCTDTESCQ